MCGQCGSVVADGDLFCRRCGASLKHLGSPGTRTEGTLISVAQAVAHRLNNALSIVLTNSQLVMHQVANPSVPLETREKLQDRLQDIAVAAANSGEVIHQFQRLLDSLANGCSQVPCSPEDQTTGKPESQTTGKPVLALGDPRSGFPAFTLCVGHISILIVDDEEKIRHALSYALTLAGYHVITASDGQEALALFQSRSYDFAFVDLKMPGMDGWEVARTIKRMDPDTMVVLMTGWRVRLDDERLKESHIDAVITKPFKLSEMSDLIAAARSEKA